MSKPSKIELSSFPLHTGMMSQEAREIPNEVAERLFDVSVVQRGAGWGTTADGVKVYGITGSHRNDYKGWIVHSFGGLR